MPHSSVQTIIHKYKHNGNVQPSYRSGRRRVLCPRDECALVQNVNINSRTKVKHHEKMLAEAGKRESVSTVKLSRVPTWTERLLSEQEARTPKAT